MTQNKILKIDNCYQNFSISTHNLIFCKLNFLKDYSELLNNHFFKMMISEISDEIRDNILDFMKLFYDGQLDDLHEYSNTDTDMNTYLKVKSLIDWNKHYKKEDLKILKNSGISFDALKDLKEKYFSLIRKNCFLPIFMQKPCSFNQFSIIYYKFNLVDIKKFCDEVNEALISTKPTFNEKYFVYHPNFQIKNLYQTLPPTISKIYRLIDFVNVQFEKISMNNFVFNSYFNILSTFLNNINKENFTPQEIFELSYNWSVLFIKGFALSQIYVKLNKNEFTSKYSTLNEDEYEQYLNICWRIQFSKLILDNFDIHEEKLNEIYRLHSNDSSKNAIDSLINELIPYYRFLTTPEGYLKITVEKSEEYESFMNKLNNLKKYKKSNADQKLKFSDDFLIFDKYVYGLYLDRISFELINNPDDSYDDLLRILLNRVNYSIFSCENKFVKLKPPCEELIEVSEVTGNLNDDLLNQKYYIINYITKMLIQNQKNDKLFFIYANTNSAALLLSILPWKITGNSDEARILERKLMDNIKISVKTRRLQSLLYDKWRKFIKKEIWDATKPLDVEKMRNKINPYIDDSCNIM